MKRLLLAALFSSAVVYSPTQARCWDHDFYDPNCPACRHNDIDGKVALVVGAVAAAGLTVIGASYLIEKIPSRRYASAQKTYAVLNDCLSCVAGKNGDVTAAATQLFLTSPYPLVEMFNHINSLHQEAKAAIEEKLENAAWWSKDKAFVGLCNRLKNQLKEHVERLNGLSHLIRSNPSWTAQYALSLQQRQNDETRKIADETRKIARETRRIETQARLNSQKKTSLIDEIIDDILF